jgi:hypothetical protein
MTNGADAIRKTRELLNEASLAMTPVGGGKIRQVEKPKDTAKANTKPKAVHPGKSGSKSAKPPKKKTKKSKENYEHIEGDSHTLNFKHGDQDLTGWIEDRGDGTFDVAVVCGKFTVVKGASKDNVVKKVKAAAAKLCGGKEIEEGKPDAAGEDILYNPKTQKKIDGEIEDKDDKETDEWFPWFKKSKKNTKKKKKKVKENFLRRTFIPNSMDNLIKQLQSFPEYTDDEHFNNKVPGGTVSVDIVRFSDVKHYISSADIEFDNEDYGLKFSFGRGGTLKDIDMGKIDYSSKDLAVYSQGKITNLGSRQDVKAKFLSLCERGIPLVKAAIQAAESEMKGRVGLK